MVYVFAGAGLTLVVLSIFAESPLFSGLPRHHRSFPVWGSTELKAQAARVELGWYTANPKPKRLPPLWKLFSRFHPPRL